MVERMTVFLKCMLQLFLCPELTGMQLWLIAEEEGVIWCVQVWEQDL